MSNAAVLVLTEHGSRVISLQRFWQEVLAGDNSEFAVWLAGMKAQMRRIIVHIRMEKGEAQTDGAAICIYLENVREVSAAYARAGTKEASVRKFSIKTLTATSGRVCVWPPAHATLD